MRQCNMVEEEVWQVEIICDGRGDLFGAIPEVMGRSADFLTFAPGGADDFTHAMKLLSEAGKDGLKARALLEAETGDLSDRVFQVGPVHVNAGIKMTSTRVAVKGAKGDGKKQNEDKDAN